MSKLFGILTTNCLVEEVLPKESRKCNNQRTLLNGTIIRIERISPDGTYHVRCLKEDGDNWETIQFKCPKNNCHVVPENLWQYLAAVESPLERVKVAWNKDRYEKLLMISVDMVVAYADDINVLLGTVKFIGKVQSIGLCYGIKLHEKKRGTRCNGSIGSVQYFNCLPGYGIFATIDRLVAHNVLDNAIPAAVEGEKNNPITPSKSIITNTFSIKSNKVMCTLHQDELPDNTRNLKSSRSFQQHLINETKRDPVNTTNDFDLNTILQSDRLQLLGSKGTKNSNALRNEECEKIAKIHESKLIEARVDFSINAPVVNNFSETEPRVIRNKSLNPISHIISSSKIVSKKAKLPTLKIYDSDSEFNQQRPCTGTAQPKDGSKVYIEPDPALTNNITVGSLVQIVDTDTQASSEMLCGVIRWLGIEMPSNQKMNTLGEDTSTAIIAGIELDDDYTPAHLNFLITDGTFCGKRRFESQNSVFVPLAMCRKDRRFLEDGNEAAGASGTLHTSEMHGILNEIVGNGRIVESNLPGEVIREAERDRDRRLREVKEKLYEAENGKPVIKGVVPPVLFKTEEDVKAVCSKFRGIQGHHNSCYLDATLFAMFTFTSVFDSLIYRPKGPGDIDQYEEVQRVLREEIVNPLRTNLFVNSERVMTLRRHLEHLSSVSGLTSEEKDPEEFLNSLLAQILHAEPFLKLNSGQESYFYQLFVEKDDRLKLPTVQQLFEQSFHTSEIKLKEVPPCLIIQMPRFGKDYKMYPRIIPSQLLDITDIIENSPRGCTICGNLAYYECIRCYDRSHNTSSTSDALDRGLENTAFCRCCVQTFHQHESRVDHKPRRLELPPDYQSLVEAGHESPQPPRLYMDLFAVVCIETSHYVAFVKCGNDLEGPWCFFDSMADREGERNGHNIPAMVACPDVSKWLSDEQSCHSLHKDIPSDRHLPEHGRRLLCDAYICMYQKSDIMMYK